MQSVSRFCDLVSSLFNSNFLSLSRQKPWHSRPLLLSSGRRMRRLTATQTVVLCFLAVAGTLEAQQQPPWEIYPSGRGGEIIYDLQTARAVATNGVVVRYGRGVMTADRISVDQRTGDAVADGTVRIQEEDQVWAGEHFRVNFRTGDLATQDFRMGQPPAFAAGEGLHGEDRFGFNQAPVSQEMSNRVF